MSLNSSHRIQEVSSDWDVSNCHHLAPNSPFISLLFALVEEVEPATTFYACFYYLFLAHNIINFKFGVARPSSSRLLQSKRFEGEVWRSSSPLEMNAFACREPLEKECRISILKLTIWKVFSTFFSSDSRGWMFKVRVDSMGGIADEWKPKLDKKPGRTSSVHRKSCDRPGWQIHIDMSALVDSLYEFR